MPPEKSESERREYPLGINELEQLTGITKQNIRFYEKKGLLHPARNAGNNYREYTQDDLIQLKTIKFLRKLDFSLEDIRGLLTNEIPLDQALEQHLKELQEKQQALHTCIDVCKTLLHKTKFHTVQTVTPPDTQHPAADSSLSSSQLEVLDIDKMLQEMDTIEKNGGKFMSIIQDYGRFAIAEESKQFSFKPDTMIQNPDEFRDALLQYAEENHLDLVITKGGMYPEFTINGTEYTAHRYFDRFGATIQCSLAHPEYLDSADVTGIRKWVYRFLRGPYIFLFLLFLLMAFSRSSFKWALLVAVMIFPYLYWLFARPR